MKGEGGVAGEGRVVGVPKFHSWGKCSMLLTNINSDWISNASSGLCINLHYIIYAGPLLLFFIIDESIISRLQKIVITAYKGEIKNLL